MDRPTEWRPAFRLTALFAISSFSVGGCAAGADFSYSEFRSSPGYSLERTYESHAYGSTEGGFGSQVCSGVGRKQVNTFGQVLAHESVACDSSQQR